MSISPSHEAYRLMMIFATVDFPQPEKPTKDTERPCCAWELNKNSTRAVLGQKKKRKIVMIKRFFGGGDEGDLLAHSKICPRHIFAPPAGGSCCSHPPLLKAPNKKAPTYGWCGIVWAETNDYEALMLCCAKEKDV